MSNPRRMNVQRDTGEGGTHELDIIVLDLYTCVERGREEGEETSSVNQESGSKFDVQYFAKIFPSDGTNQFSMAHYDFYMYKSFTKKAMFLFTRLNLSRKKLIEFH